MMWWPLPRYSFWLLGICSLTGHVAVVTFSLPGCNDKSNFDIVQSQQPSLTCTNLTAQHNIYWSITDPSSKEETRIAECTSCKPKCPPCSDPITGYNVSREMDDRTTLQFLNTSQVIDGSIIKCSAFLNNTDATCRLFVVPAYTISECKNNAFKVQEGISKPIRCGGLLPLQGMYWTITYGNGTVSTIAECKSCGNSSTECPKCNVTNSDFNVTREGNSSTLVIHNNIKEQDDTTLKCSKRDNVTYDDCTLCVEPDAFNLPQCNRYRNFDIVQNEQPSLTCTGLRAGHNIYWSITDPSSNKETRIGECGNCGESCSPCSSLVDGYNVSRQEGSTTLQFLNPALITDESRVMCSSVNNCTKKMCTLFVVQAYSISGCSDNTLTITEKRTTSVRCDGLLAGQNMYWTITYHNGTVSTIAECKVCKTPSGGCPSCTSLNEDFNVRREENSSTLVIQNNVEQKDGATLRCSKKDNVTHADCTISVQALHSTQATSTDLPVSVVAGGVVGFASIIAVAVVIAVVIKRKRSIREAAKRRQDTVTPDDEFEEHINEYYQSADDPDLPRHSLQHSLAPLSLVNPSVVAQGAGLDGPQNHVYAQVNKEKKKKFDVSEEQPGTTHDVKQHAGGGKTQKHADKGENQGPSSEEQGAVYTECVSDAKIDNSGINVYMNVDESPPRPTDQDTQAAKKESGNVDSHDPDPSTYYNTDTNRHQGDYTNVQLELHEAEGMTKTAESADDYRHLQFTRPEQLEENPNYNHLTDL